MYVHVFHFRHLPHFPTDSTKIMLSLHLFPTSVLLIVSTETVAWVLPEHDIVENGRTADLSDEPSSKSIHVFLDLSDLLPWNSPLKLLMIWKILKFNFHLHFNNG